jgi:hypothetical protein
MLWSISWLNFHFVLSILVAVLMAEESRGEGLGWYM